VWASLETLGKWHNSILKEARVAVIQFVLLFGGGMKGKIKKEEKSKETSC